jgi:Tol biopolymer transport system component
LILINQDVFTARKHDLPPQTSHRIHWTSDGRAILYAEPRNGVANIWRLPLDGSSPVQLTNFKSGLIFKFDLSANGKQIVIARGNSASDAILITDFR